MLIYFWRIVVQIGNYGGKAYEFENISNRLYMCFIDDKTVLIG